MSRTLLLLPILFLFNSCLEDVKELIDPDECFAPSDITVTDISRETATINWTNAGNTLSTKISFGEGILSADDGNSASSLATAYILTNLNSETTYTYFLKSICLNEESDWQGPLTFTTDDAEVISCIQPNGFSHTFTPSGSDTDVFISWNDDGISYSVDVFINNVFAQTLSGPNSNITLTNADSGTNIKIEVTATCTGGSMSEEGAYTLVVP